MICGLDESQISIMKLLVKGQTDKEIAGNTGVKLHVINNLVNSINMVYGVHSRTAALAVFIVRYLTENSWHNPPSSGYFINNQDWVDLMEILDTKIKVNA